MNSKLKYGFFIAFLALEIFACSPGLYIPTVADTQITGISADTLSLGRNLYVKNCSSCHNLFKADHFTKIEWTRVILVMQKKAKCTTHETSLIFNYLSTRSK